MSNPIQNEVSGQPPSMHACHSQHCKLKYHFPKHRNNSILTHITHKTRTNQRKRYINRSCNSISSGKSTGDNCDRNDCLRISCVPAADPLAKPPPAKTDLVWYFHYNLVYLIICIPRLNSEKMSDSQLLAGRVVSKKKRRCFALAFSPLLTMSEAHDYDIDSDDLESITGSEVSDSDKNPEKEIEDVGAEKDGPSPAADAEADLPSAGTLLSSIFVDSFYF
jgi:hypothetical protein